MHQAFGSREIERPTRGARERLAREQSRRRALGAGETAGRGDPRGAAGEQVGDLVVDREPHQSLAGHRIVDRALAVDVLALRHVVEHAEEPLAVTHTTREPTLERQRDEHDLPATVDLADAPLVADAHVVEEGDVDALAGERAHLLEADPGRVHRHQEEGEAGVLRALGAGAGEEEDPVGFLGDAGEHLLAVDAPVVAVAHGAGPCRRHVRTRIGLGVAQAHHRVTRQEARQHLGADHLVAHVREHRRHHHHVAQPVVGRARALQLGEQRRQLFGIATAAALRFGKCLRDPTAFADRAVQGPTVDRAGLVDLLAHLVGERGGDEVADLGAERFRGCRRQEVHQRVPTSAPYRRAARRWYSCVGVSITSGQPLARR